MRTEPTPEQNRAAIDALKAEEKPKFKLHSARCGLDEDKSYYFPIYHVIALNEDDLEVSVAHFPVYSGSIGRDRARFLAEDLTRRINAGEYEGS